MAIIKLNNNSLTSVTSLPSGLGGTDWQTVKTTNFSAVAGKGYPVNT